MKNNSFLVYATLLMLVIFSAGCVQESSQADTGIQPEPESQLPAAEPAPSADAESTELEDAPSEPAPLAESGPWCEQTELTVGGPVSVTFFDISQVDYAIDDTFTQVYTKSPFTTVLSFEVAPEKEIKDLKINIKLTKDKTELSSLGETSAKDYKSWPVEQLGYSEWKDQSATDVGKHLLEARITFTEGGEQHVLCPRRSFTVIKPEGLSRIQYDTLQITPLTSLTTEPPFSGTYSHIFTELLQFKRNQTLLPFMHGYFFFNENPDERFYFKYDEYCDPPVCSPELDELELCLPPVCFMTNYIDMTSDFESVLCGGMKDLYLANILHVGGKVHMDFTRLDVGNFAQDVC
ncbi:MAG: hypothetical protein ABIG20_01670 [archaeon]